MIKKLLMAAAVVAMAVPAAAQGSRRSEVSVSYGVAPVTDWIDSYSDMLTGLFTNANTDLKGWGAVTVGYSFRLIGSLRLGAGVRGNGPLSDLDANLILAGLEGHAVVRDVDDFAHHTADRDDIVTDFQIGTHFIELFLLLVLRKDQKQIEDDKHQNDHDNG